MRPEPQRHGVPRPEPGNEKIIETTYVKILTYFKQSVNAPVEISFFLIDIGKHLTIKYFSRNVRIALPFPTIKY
jgi:hypothetical protein